MDNLIIWFASVGLPPADGIRCPDGALVPIEDGSLCQSWNGRALFTCELSVVTHNQSIRSANLKTFRNHSLTLTPHTSIWCSVTELFSAVGGVRLCSPLWWAAGRSCNNA